MNMDQRAGLFEEGKSPPDSQLSNKCRTGETIVLLGRSVVLY